MQGLFKTKTVILFVVFLELYGWMLSLAFGSRSVVLVDDIISICALLIVLFFLAHRGKVKRAILNTPLIYFLIVFSISMIINFVQIDIALMQLRSYILMISLYYLILWSNVSNKEILSILKVILLLFIPVFLSVIFEYTIGENILVSQDRYGQDFSEGGVFRSHSLIGNPIDYANYAIIIMSISLSSIILKYKLFFSKKNNYIVFILMFMTLFMANSKGPILAIILSLIVMSFYLRFLTIRGVVYSLILLVVIGITMGDSLIDRFTDAHLGSDSDYRVLYLIKTIEVFSDYPVFGIGPGIYGGWVSINYSPSYAYDLYDFSTDRISSIDMFFPHLIGELGLLGFFSYMLFFIRPFQYFKNIFKRSDIKEVQFVSLISLLVIPMLFLIGWFSIALENQMIISLYFILIGMSEKFVKNKGKLKDD